jgi:hypothetical protein
MSKHVFTLAIALSLLASSMIHAEDAVKKADEAGKKDKKGEVERFYPRGPEIATLKTELGLNDADVAKIKAAVAEVNKKNEAIQNEAEVKAAEEQVKKAKEALKAAEDKAKAAADGFDLLEEHKKAIYNNVPDDKKEKAQDLIHYKIKKEKKTEKKDEKKEEKK